MIKRLASSREAILLAALFLLLALIASRFTGFVAPSNMVNVFNDTAPLIILALGQMVVILTRCIDLSMAANLALTGMATAMINTLAPDLAIPIIILIAILMGATMGLLNGLLVWKLEIPPIVVTLGTMTIFRGVIFLLSDGKWVNSHEMSASFTGFPRTTLLSVPILSWIAILSVIFFGVLMTRTSLGRSFFAVGGNPHAAVYTGINVGKTQCIAFIISGGLAGLTGYLWVARYAVAYVDIAKGFELEVVAACVIGGISIAGGIGSVTGVLLGALFLGVVKNALPVVNISPFWQLALTGGAILIAVALNSRSGTKGRMILRTSETET